MKMTSMGGRLSMRTPGFVTALMPNTLGPIESNKIGATVQIAARRQRRRRRPDVRSVSVVRS
jgi:hypothetical protein